MGQTEMIVRHEWVEIEVAGTRWLGIDLASPAIDYFVYDEETNEPLHIFHGGDENSERLSTYRGDQPSGKTAKKWRSFYAKTLKKLMETGEQQARTEVQGRRGYREDVGLLLCARLRETHGTGDDGGFTPEWEKALMQALVRERDEASKAVSQADSDDDEDVMAEIGKTFTANPFMNVKGAAATEAAAGNTARAQQLEVERTARERAAEAHREKESGNTAFKQGNLKEAMERYARALELLPERAVEAVACRSNRAQCALKLGLFEDAIVECDDALRRDPSHSKSRYRRALACEALGRLPEAKAELRRLVRADPKNNDAQLLLTKLLQTSKTAPPAPDPN